MKYLALYHPQTGQITGRIRVTEDSQAELYPHRIEVSREQWATPLEKLQVVDVKTKELVDMADAEVNIHGRGEQ